MRIKEQETRLNLHEHDDDDDDDDENFNTLLILYHICCHDKKTMHKNFYIKKLRGG